MQDEETAPRSALSATLERLRNEHDWSRRVLGERSGVAESTITRYELDIVNRRTGKVDVPRAATLRKLAEGLGDGNAERAREAERDLYSAAGYKAAEPVSQPQDGARITQLEARLAALESRTGRPSADVTAQVRRLIESYSPEEKALVIRLMQEALRRFEEDPER